MILRQPRASNCLTGILHVCGGDPIGMDADELLRLKQVGGLAAMFKDEDYSKAWK